MLGLLMHGTILAPLGILQTLQLQFFLNNVVSKVPAHLQGWWQGQRLVLPRPILRDLQRLEAALLPKELDPPWSRLISIIIPCDPTHLFHQ